MKNKNNMVHYTGLKEVIDTLLSDKFYNAGECVEIAKGKYEYSKGLKVNFRKLKRQLKTLNK